MRLLPEEAAKRLVVLCVCSCLLLPVLSPPYEALKETYSTSFEPQCMQQQRQRHAAAAEFEQQVQQRRAQEEAQERQRKVSKQSSWHVILLVSNVSSARFCVCHVVTVWAEGGFESNA